MNGNGLEVEVEREGYEVGRLRYLDGGPVRVVVDAAMDAAVGI